MIIFDSATAIKVVLNTDGPTKEFMIISRQELFEISAHAERMLDSYKLPQSLRTNAYVDFRGKEIYEISDTQEVSAVCLRLRRRSDKNWEVTRATKEPVCARSRKEYFIWLTERQYLAAARRICNIALKNSGLYGDASHR